MTASRAAGDEGEYSDGPPEGAHLPRRENVALVLRFPRACSRHIRALFLSRWGTFWGIN